MDPYNWVIYLMLLILFRLFPLLKRQKRFRITGTELVT